MSGTEILEFHIQLAIAPQRFTDRADIARRYRKQVAHGQLVAAWRHFEIAFVGPGPVVHFHGMQGIVLAGGEVDPGLVGVGMRQQQPGTAGQKQKSTDDKQCTHGKTPAGQDSLEADEYLSG
ncbi:hypothetical protein D9M71_405920 [compost metagenome]